MNGCYGFKPPFGRVATIAHRDLLCTYTTAAFDAVKGLTPEANVDADYLITDLHLRVQGEVFDKGCIALVMPTLSSRNVPIGVQVIANTYDDLAAMRVSAALSKTLPQNYRDGRFPDFRNRK